MIVPRRPAAGMLLFEVQDYVRHFKERLLSAIEKEELLTLLCYPLVMVFCVAYLVTDSQWFFGVGVSISMVLMIGEAYLTKRQFSQDDVDGVDTINT